MFDNDSLIMKYKKELAALSSKRHDLLQEDEDVHATPGSELDQLFTQIDNLIENEYSKAVFDYYSPQKPQLIRVYTGEEVSWIDAFGNSFELTTKGQRHSLVGLIEGGSKYRLK